MEVQRRIEECDDELNLASLKIAVFPGDIFGIHFLRTLNLRGNMMEYLPPSMELLTKLEILNLSENGFKMLPDSFGGMTCLKKLQLHNNKLKELPKSIGKLENLQELYVGSNRLTGIPDEISNLVYLERLDASNNCLTQLPDSLNSKSLPNLRVVNFQGNGIVAMSWSVQCLQEVYPVLVNAEERSRLVKRNLRIKQRVNERLLV